MITILLLTFLVLVTVYTNAHTLAVVHNHSTTPANARVVTNPIIIHPCPACTLCNNAKHLQSGLLKLGRYTC